MRTPGRAEDGATRMVIEAVPTSCAEAAEHTRIGNGQHGTCRTFDDVPDPQKPETVRGEKDRVSRADLDEIIATLAAPYVPAGAAGA